jgi:hypothetical protein
MNPPTMLVTGECLTVGLASGFVQGGGYGPWSPLKGFCVHSPTIPDKLTGQLARW